MIFPVTVDRRRAVAILYLITKPFCVCRVYVAANKQQATGNGHLNRCTLKTKYKNKTKKKNAFRVCVLLYAQYTHIDSSF